MSPSRVIFPIVMGSGKRLLDNADESKKLALVNSSPTDTGRNTLTYRPA